jgi:hypothetical protein
MIETQIGAISASLLSLERRKGSYIALAEQFDGGGELEADALSALDGDLTALRKACVDAGFQNAPHTIDTAQRWSYPSGVGFHAYAAAQSEIEHVLDSVWRELDKRHFFHLSPERAQYFNHAALLGESVNRVFPPAVPDIREAGNCLATDRNTAAVFHLMRSIEWGLRALCGHLGLNQAKRSRRGKVSYVPLAYSEWEALLNQLQPKVDTKIEKIRRGPRKQVEQEFYYGVLQDIRGIRDAWRNHVMHTRAEYSAQDADAIFEHVRRVMATLAERFTTDHETSPRGSKPKILVARYGKGGSEYLDVTEPLRGFIATGTEVFASNHFFSDPYPHEHKTLVVQYSVPPSRAKKTATFREGDRLVFPGTR